MNSPQFSHQGGILHSVTMAPSASGEGVYHPCQQPLSCACKFPHFHGRGRLHWCRCLHIPGSSACTNADARTEVDACINTDAHTHTYADSFLRLLLRTVSSSSLTSMRRFAAPTIWGFEVYFAASYPFILIWKSQLTSAHFAQAGATIGARLLLASFRPK
jgi:hypothetical protein